jgi:hypothetical protein
VEAVMQKAQNHSRYPTNWGIHFLCDCKKRDREINVHKGIAQEISTHGVCILSDHHICRQKKIAMQLLIPSLLNGVPQKIVKVIGHSISTVMKEGRYLTEIEFLHFEENGLKELDRNLRQYFEPGFLARTMKHA